MEDAALERRERTNAQAMRAKNNQEDILLLWDDVAGYISHISYTYWRSCNHSILDFEDYFHSSYFGFLRAIEAYDINRGSFLTILTFYVMDSCRAEFRRVIKNEHISLDAPHREDGDAILLNLLPDPHSDDAFEKISIQSVIRALCKEHSYECKAAKRESATDPYRKKCVAAFKRDFTSAVEAVVLRKG